MSVTNSLSVWFRVIRIRFLLASVIAVSVGLVISWQTGAEINTLHAALIMGAVVALHAWLRCQLRGTQTREATGTLQNRFHFFERK